MSDSASLADYRAALRVPDARWPVLTSLLGRLPIAMIGLALMLYVQRTTGSFAIAGIASACELTGVAIGSVVQGRVMDRVGPSRPLYVMSAVFTVLAAVEIVAIENHWSPGLLAVLSLILGCTAPMLAPASRALWAQLLPPGPTRYAAYSYEAISMEVFFILGPGLAGILVASPWGGTGFVAGSICLVIGCVGFATTPAARRHRPAAAQRNPSLLGALASPGMRTVCLAALGFGALLGFIEVAVPATAYRAGYPALGGVLVSVASISSVAVGVVYGMRPWPRALHQRLPVLLLGFAVLVALLAAPESLWGLTGMLLLAGCLITPQATTHSLALEVTAPSGTATEAFGWVVTSVTLGSAFGQSASGALVEHSGPPVAFLLAGAVGLLLAGLLWARRGTVRPTTQHEVGLVAH